MKYVNTMDGREFDNEEDARMSVLDFIDDGDVAEQLGYIATQKEIVAELRRLDSPLYHRAMEATENSAYDDYISEEYDEEEEEDE